MIYMVIIVLLLCLLVLMLIDTIFKLTKQNDKKTDMLLDSGIVLVILCAFVRNIRDEISYEVLHNCMTNAIRTCVNKDLLSATDSTNSYEDTAKAILHKVDEINEMNMEGE